jgi:transcriptional regulator with XRE-family HTH domain
MAIIEDGKSQFQALEIRRKKLGMTKRILAQRSGVSLPTVQRLLSGQEQNPSFANVRAIAMALGMELKFGEAQDAYEFKKSQAANKAQRIVRMVQATMALEAQGVDSKTIRQMIDRTTCELLSREGRRLWED